MLATELLACGGGWPRALGRRHGPADCYRATPERIIGHVARLSLTPTQPSPVGRTGGWRQQGVRRFAPRHWAARRSRTGDDPGVVAEQQPLEHGDDRQLGQEALVLRAQKLAQEAWLRSRASCPLRASTSHSFPLAGGGGATDPIARLVWSDPRNSGSPSH